MMNKYLHLFPHWNKINQAYAMLDPADSSRSSSSSSSNSMESSSTMWEYIYRMPEAYVNGKLVCSEY